MDEEKKELRKRVLALREALTEEERYRAKILLTERILGHQWFYGSDTLLGFVNYGSEIDVSDILTEALRAGKRVYVPKVKGEELSFYRIFSLKKLTPGYKGIPEPAGNEEQYCYQEGERVLLLMPGAVFDVYGNRMGYGKGFYDRFLADKETLKERSIAVGFACQRVEQVPVREHDIRPGQIICV